MFLTCVFIVKGSKDDRLRWIFSLYDTDDSGTIDLEELTSVLKLVESMKSSEKTEIEKQEIARVKAKKMMERLDSDGNAELDFEEFRQGATEDPTIIESLAYNKYDGLM